MFMNVLEDILLKVIEDIFDQIINVEIVIVKNSVFE